MKFQKIQYNFLKYLEIKIHLSKRFAKKFFKEPSWGSCMLLFIRFLKIEKIFSENFTNFHNYINIEEEFEISYKKFNSSKKQPKQRLLFS